ncbi:MAG TPA: zinc ribbon domain-containing protein [Longimicrobiales bacterium]|nr:zinc ribbon domain-containing protein [Longimicrobiales bacterium]
MTDDTLQRFFHALVDALRERSPADVSGPFTVAEIYQDLVPYRTHRDRLGVEINGDYEHALLRLLAGQGDYLLLESEHALKEIRAELEGLNPNTSLYRDFAAVDVRIEPDAVPDDGYVEAAATSGEHDAGDDAEQDPVPDADAAGDSSSADDFEMTDVDSLADDAGVAPDTSEAETAFVEGAAPGTSEPVAGEAHDAAEAPVTTGPAASGVPAGGSCGWCGADLPDREGLVFCPFCGENQTRVPCGSCGEALEADWEFCISCGVRTSQ